MQTALITARQALEDWAVRGRNAEVLEVLRFGLDPVPEGRETLILALSELKGDLVDRLHLPDILERKGVQEILLVVNLTDNPDQPFIERIGIPLSDPASIEGIKGETSEWTADPYGDYSVPDADTPINTRSLQAYHTGWSIWNVTPSNRP
jgi:hypothetical protein